MAYFKTFNNVEYDFDGSGINKTIKDLSQYSTIISKNLDNVSFYSYYSILDGERPDTVSQKLYGTPAYYWMFFLINDDLQNYWHDWPKGSEALRSYIEEEFVGLAAIFDADVSAFGKFVKGGTVQGSLSLATGKVVGIYPTAGYIQIEQDTTSPADFRTAGETITLTASNSALAADVGKVGNTLSCNSIVKTAYAPAHHISDSTLERTRRQMAGTSPVTNFEVSSNQNLAKSKIKVVKPEFIGDIVEAFEKAMRES